MLLALVISNTNLFSQTEKLPITIAVSKTPLSSPFYIAKHINAFEDTCVEVQFTEVNGGLAAFEKLMEQQVDFATSSDSVIVSQRLLKHNFASHAVFAQSDNDVKLITRLADNINSITALKGKKVGVVKATASEYFLSILLALQGLEISEVSLINYQPQQLPLALINKEVDAIVPWEPFAFESKILPQNAIHIHNTKGLNTLSFNLLSKKTDPLLTTKAQCLLQGLNTAIEYIAANPEEAKTIVQQTLNLSDEFIDWVWADYIFKLSLNNALILDLKSQSDWAISSQHLTNEPPNLMDFIDTKALLMVDPHVVNIQN